MSSIIDTMNLIEVQRRVSASDEQTIRADCIKNILELKPEIYKWLIKRDTEGYGTTLGECVDKIFEEIEKTLKVTK